MHWDCGICDVEQWDLVEIWYGRWEQGLSPHDPVNGKHDMTTLPKGLNCDIISV